jgi:hypothetical protein
VNDLILWIVAISVLVIAIVQVAMFIWATRLARRVGESVTRLEQDVRPILTGLQTMAAEAARAATVAASQVERAVQMIEALRQRIDGTVRALQATLLTPARELMALLQAFREVFFGGRGRSTSDARRRQAAEEDDALFIG